MTDQREHETGKLEHDPIAGEEDSPRPRTAARPTAEVASPTVENLYWYKFHRDEPYFDNAYGFQDYAPAYRLGYMHRMKNSQSTWAQAEIQLQADWARNREGSRLRWEEARQAAHAAWLRMARIQSNTDEMGTRY